MTRPAARELDYHSCPATLPVAHVGGQISGLSVASVVIGYRGAAAQGSLCNCAVMPGNTISTGSASVKIGHRAAARIGDPTTHGGIVISGCGSVLVGD